MSPLLASMILASLGSGEPMEPLHGLESYSLTSELALAEARLAAPLQDGGEGVDLSYTFFEIGGTALDVDAAGEEADVLHARASLGLGMFHLAGRYESQEIDVLGTSIDADVLYLGVGAHFSLTPKLDIEGDVSWVYNDVSGGSGIASSLDDSNSGYVVRVGPRWMVLPWSNGGLELNGDVRLIDVDGMVASEPDEDVFGFALGARAHFLRLFSAGINYVNLDDDDSIGANLRVSF